jgi:hypothetical protein
VAACPAECTVAFSEFGPCEDEFAAVLSCMLRSPEFDALFDRICAGEEITDVEAEQLAAICQSQALAFAGCIDATPPDTGGGSCTLEDNCAGCDSSCDLCECSEGSGSTECDSLCGRGGETCTAEDNCVGCTTNCDSCNCVLGADDELCIETCAGEI